MNELLITVLSFIVALGVLITVHEFGHFWVARRSGVKVLRFSVGFGRALWSRRGKKDGTEYVIAALPLGGYVKMLDEREGEVPLEQTHRAFNRQPLRIRTAIVLAGPLFNLAFAILVYWVILMVGEPGLRAQVGEVATDSPAAHAGLQVGDRLLSVDGEPALTWERATMVLLSGALGEHTVRVEVEDAQGIRQVRAMDVAGVADKGAQVLDQIGITPFIPKAEPIIGKTTADGAARAAGLQEGDRVLSADGQPVGSWSDWVDIVHDHPEVDMAVRIQRGEVEMTLILRPDAVVEDGKTIGRIGAYGLVDKEARDRYWVVQSMGPIDAFGRALERTWDMSALMLRMLWKMAMGKASVENLSGPITIAQYAGQSASIGLMPFFKFLAVVSISLGVLNLLPIPLLDGGHLFFYLIEAVKGTPVSEKAQLVGQQVGLGVLLGLMGLAFYMDLSRLFG
ncbi:MAG: RIP metalloprotease RseP [Chromatiales bacterium]|nr:RIP metalloprotease RseP [Chromatiales bacterium]